MQIEDPTQIPSISQKTGFSIFSFPRNFNFNQIEFKNAFIVEPEDFEKNPSGMIKRDQITEVFSLIGNRQEKSLTILFRPAERINNVASSAFLKNLEEPGDNVHIVFFTHDLQQILPTIRSRASIYHLKQNFDLDAAPDVPKKDLDLAKSLLTTNSKQLIPLAEDLHKTKNNARQRTLDILDIAIELAYKSYFKTFDAKWLKKLTQLTTAYDCVKRNGHIKLQLIANML